jgi:hypothetical protein
MVIVVPTSTICTPVERRTKVQNQHSMKDLKDLQCSFKGSIIAARPRHLPHTSTLLQMTDILKEKKESTCVQSHL